MLRLFDRNPGYEAATYAEARSLIDDGLERDFVLGLFPDDAEWLAPLLDTTDAVAEMLGAEQPGYYFEASLRAKFLAAAREAGQPELAAAAAPLARLRTAFAGVAVMAGAAAAGIVTLGFVTAGSSVPGDWNYSFKLANERLQYALSSGDGRVNVQLRQTETRVKELHTVTTSGSVSASDIGRLQRELSELEQLIRSQQLDEEKKARVSELIENTAAALNDVKAKNPDLATAVGSAENTASGVGTAAGLGTPTPLKTPEPTPTPTAAGTTQPLTEATETPQPSTTPTAPASSTPTSTAPAETPSPSSTAAP